MESDSVPGAEIAQYGIAIFAVATMGYVFIKVFAETQTKSKDTDKLMQVIENNTAAIQELLSLIREMQIEITKEQMKLDELVDITRNTLKRGWKQDE